MEGSNSSDLHKWYAVQTRSNMEKKVVTLLNSMIDIENMSEYVAKEDILRPTETVSEIRNGKKFTRERNLYPGYIFVKVKLFDEDDKLIDKPWYFIRGINGVINFMGGDKPVALKKIEVERIFDQLSKAGTVRPKVEFEVGENVKINDGPFFSLTGQIEKIDPENCKLMVSVSIFGRFTPVELEYGQVQKLDESE